MTFEAIDWLESHIKKTDVLFEWGSGGSTLFFAERAAHVTSIEHDERWYEVIQDVIQSQKRANIKYALIPPEPLRPDQQLQQKYYSTNENYQGYHFEAYCSAINWLPDTGFDLISVDGRARNGCVFHAYTRVRPGGILVLDNADRPHYEEGKNLLSSWKRLDFYGPGPYNTEFWLTAIYVRPREQ